MDSAAASLDASRVFARWYLTRQATPEHPSALAASASESPSQATSLRTSRSRSLRALNAVASTPSPTGPGAPTGDTWLFAIRARLRLSLASVFQATAYSHGKGSAGTPSILRRQTTNVS